MMSRTQTTAIESSSGTSLAREGRSGTGAATERLGPADTVAAKHVMSIAYAFWKSKALFSAVELDLFTVLVDGPLDAHELADRLQLHERGARDFFDALVALGLLQRREHRYANRPGIAQHLDRRHPCYLGDLLKHLNQRHYQNWHLLTEALRTGMPQSGALGAGYSTLYADAATQDIFLNGMSAGSLLSAKALAAKFPWHNYNTVVDIGTAQGCVPVEIASVHGHLTGGGFDLPAIESEFVDYVRKAGLSARLRFYPGDFFADPLPSADVLVMGRILHNWDVPTRKLLLDKAYQAVPDGGAVIVYDPLIDETRTEPHGLLSSLNMLIETKGGSEYTGEDCMLWMQQAGFSDTRIEPLADVHTAVIGFKHRR